METLYIETSVVSYLTSRLSRDIVILAHQEITREWWDYAKIHYERYVSEIVYEEAEQGDPNAAALRLEKIKGIPFLELTDEVEKLTEIYIKELNIPEKALRDAAHLAIASVHNMDYLITWNCSHIANGEIKKKLFQVNNKYKLHTPIICTPEELLGE